MSQIPPFSEFISPIDLVLSFSEFLDLLNTCLANHRNLIENVKLDSNDETVQQENERLRENFRQAKLAVIRAYERIYSALEKQQQQ